MIGIVFRFWGLLAQADHGEDIATVWDAHMMGEVADSHHFVVPGLGISFDLPQWPPLHIGSLTLDMSPTKHVIWIMMAATLCALVLIWTARKTHGRGAEKAPRGLANVIEAFIIYLRDDVVMRNVGKGGERYVPFVLTLFFFILFMNLLGLVPFGSAATGNIMVTAALAVLALVAIEVGGAIHLGPKAYMKTIVYVPEGLPWYGQIPMALIMTPVEAIAKLARIFALAIRLFANMTAGHLVILALVGLIFIAGAGAGAAKWAIAPAPVLMAVAIMLLEIFISLLQAYIFTMLTSVFIGLVRHPH